MTALLICWCGVLGLLVGSFLNVVIYRVPEGRSIVRPRSACPSCGTPIANRDNVPVVSWLLLRGRCRSCGAPISVRYPLVEAATAVLFAAVAARFGAVAQLPAYLVFAAGLLALACIDAEVRLLPRTIVYSLFATLVTLLLVASSATGRWHAFWLAVAGAAGWFLLFYGINRADERLLGFGDVRMALPLGFGLGWLGVLPLVLGFMAANVLGLVFSVALMARHRWQWHAKLPYGTFLALGAGVAVFAGPSLHVRWHA